MGNPFIVCAAAAAAARRTSRNRGTVENLSMIGAKAVEILLMKIFRAGDVPSFERVADCARVFAIRFA
jgi:hypothetical protein